MLVQGAYAPNDATPLRRKSPPGDEKNRAAHCRAVATFPFKQHLALCGSGWHNQEEVLFHHIVFFMDSGGHMRLEVIYEYLSLATHLSFTSAAEELHVTQPTLSRHIIELEKELGVQLFNRGNRISLTLPGEILFSTFLNLTRIYDSGIESCRQISQQQTILILGPRDIQDSTVLTLCKYIREFRKDEDNLSVRFVPHCANRIEQALLNGSSDLAIMYYQGAKETLLTNIDSDQFNYAYLATERLSLLIHEDHHLAQQDTVSLDDVANVSILSASEHIYPYEHVISKLKTSEGHPLRISIAECDSFSDLLFTATKNSGYLIPNSLMNDPIFLTRPEMVFIPISDSCACFSSCLIMSKHSENFAANRLVELCKRQG